mgnify:CR=1 FL=1
MRGFSLLEMMVATLVAGILLASMAPLWPAMNRGAVATRNRMAAVHLAQQQLEQSLSQGYAGVAARSGDVQVQSTVRNIAQRVDYHYEVSVADVPPDLRSVLVRVTWKERERNLQETLQSLLVSP